MSKYLRFAKIGEASASIVLAALSANPAFAALTTGLTGKIVFFVFKIIFMFLASLGLIVLNVGAATIQTIVDKTDYNGTWDEAERIIDQIRNSGRELTPEEVKAIDGPVIAAFRKFGRFGRPKK